VVSSLLPLCPLPPGPEDYLIAGAAIATTLAVVTATSPTLRISLPAIPGYGIYPAGERVEARHGRALPGYPGKISTGLSRDALTRIIVPNFPPGKIRLRHDPLERSWQHGQIRDWVSSRTAVSRLVERCSFKLGKNESQRGPSHVRSHRLCSPSSHFRPPSSVTSWRLLVHPGRTDC